MLIDAIFTNARIRTLDPARPAASRIGVTHGRIVGLDSDLDGVTARRTIDLQGAPVLPGFHDAHNHLSFTGARLASLDLRHGVIQSTDALYAAVARKAAELPADGWVRGSGYDQNFLGGHPTAERLDAAAGGRPVILEHVSGHMITVSTRAFELAGYPGRHGVPDFDGGFVARAADGRAEGLLQERAMSFIYELVRPMGLDEVQRNLALAGEQALRYGLTSITEPGIGAYKMVGNSPVDFHSYQQAVENGVLSTRVTLMPYCTTLHDVEGFKDGGWFGLDLGIRTGLGNDRLQIGPVKIVSDGSFIGRSAAMHHCYHGEPDNHGVLLFDPAELQAMIIGAHEAGWTVATHAIGDAAIDHVMDAVEKAQRNHPRPEARHRIEHFALATDAQITRAAALGLTAVPQGVFISDFGDGMIAAVEPELAPLIYRMKSLLKAGMVLPGSSDSPVSDGNPLVSLHDMVNRRTSSGTLLGPDERLTVEEAVRAYTFGSAYAVGQERDKGQLRVGQLADFVALSDDLFAIPEETIRNVTVGATVIGGEVVFNDGVLGDGESRMETASILAG
ncbi:amidohydrolase [Arthrobacter sp. ISL-72]|uniref:amidohydrolase n=1 Tax=Arthrobacter sp. ISL-72 TaxID=2819114 RepID=UPI001BEA5F3B|nr:amidohydrolase [Arthrobacter sp. ISL-72]MBT2597895.1 amidohydrolase [Arthrobacter sp. ISL-72]